MPGHCGFHPNHDGIFALSSGSDATIRVHDIRDQGPKSWWRTEDESEPELSDLSGTDLHDKAVGCLAIAPDSLNMATGSDDGFVRIFSLKSAVKGKDIAVDAELVQACARFGGPVRAIDFSPTGAFLAVAGDEPGVLKIVMTAQPSNVTVLRAPSGKGNEAISALKFDPDGDFIASVSEKGNVIVWGVERGKLLTVVDLNSRNAKCLAWSPAGSHLVCGTEKGIVVVKRDSWTFDYLLEDASDHDDDEDEIYASSTGKDRIAAVAWSLNGRYLVAAREDSNVSLWDAQQRKVLASWRGQEVAQKIHWHPKSNALLLIDKIGQWGLIPDVVPSHLPSPYSDALTVRLPTLPQPNDKADMQDIPRDVIDDEEDVNSIKRSKGVKVRHLKQRESEKKDEAVQEKKKKKNGGSSAEEEDENELENGFTFNASDVDADEEEDIRSRDDGGSGECDDNSESDEELPGEFAGLENGGVRLPARTSKSRSRSLHGRRRARQALIVQKSFMPTSTPLSEQESKKRRILAWNLVGAVLSFDESTHDIVEIEFADASKRTIGIKDHFGYTLSCLTEVGVLLASPKKKEHGSLITFRPFSSWSNNSDWTQYLHPDEDISVIALGQRFAAAITTPNGLVRIFSLSGIQTAIFGVHGHIVTAAAGDDSLVIVFVEPDSSVIKCELLGINGAGEVENIRFAGNIMLCANSRLEWIGFSKDTGELCSYDSNGWLWMLMDPKNGKRWVPVVQGAAKLGECDWFWVAAATSTHVIGVPCLSTERFPSAKPRPALRSLPLSAPVIEKVSKSGKPKIIERYVRTRMKLIRATYAKAVAEDMYNSDDDEVADAEDEVARMEVETDKCILAMMEDACRNEHNMRALDLATRLHSEVSFKYAIELAKHFKRSVLATRVEQVALRKIKLMQADERVGGGPSGKVSSSPVSPAPPEDPESYEAYDGFGDGKTGDADAMEVDGIVEVRKPLLNFDREDGNLPHPAATTRKNDADFGFDNVTDDEDESPSVPEERKRQNKKAKRALAKAGEGKKDDTKSGEGKKDGTKSGEDRKDGKKSGEGRKGGPKAVPRKRSLTMPQSQASVKEGIGGPVAKQAKMSIGSKAKNGGLRKTKFKNRFLMK